MKSIKEIKTDLSFVKDYEVVVFGSYAGKRADKRSDVDIAVITKEKDRDKCMKIWMEVLGKAPKTYDIKIFELLPLHIKASLFNNYVAVFGNSLDISEYFYEFRKLWNDMKYRFRENRFQSAREKATALERYRGSQKRKMALKA